MSIRIKKIYSALLIMAVSCVVNASNDWVSEIDKKYVNINYDLYEKTMKAKSLISKAKGDTDLLGEATTLINNVLQADPDFIPAYVQAARLYSKLGHLPGNKISEQALAAMEEYLTVALDKEPEYGYAYAMMGFTKMKANELDEAEKYYLKAEETGTKYPYLKSQRAELLLKNGKPQEALQLASEGYYENLSQPSIAAGYATTAIQATFKMSNSADEQESWQKKRIEVAPDVAWFLGDYSRFLLYVRHDYDSAIEYAEKALEKMDYGMGRQYLALGYYGKWEKLDDDPSTKEEAAKYFEKATLVYPVSDNLLSTISKNRNFFKLYTKLLNYKIKVDNAKQDLQLGIITQDKYDALVATPENVYAR